MAIRLECDSHGFQCPHCHKTLSVESWDTEYNEPSPGMSRVFCPCCDNYFNIEVYVEVHIAPSLIVPS